MRVYHVTTIESAREITEHDFRDGEGCFLTSKVHRGVFVSDRPLWIESGIDIEDLACIEVEIADKYLAGCEWIEEGKSYREWLVPASVLNGNASRRLLTESEFFALDCL